MDFERAVGNSQEKQQVLLPVGETVQLIARNEKLENPTVQNPVQQASESAGTELQEREKKPTFVGSVDSLPDGATTILPKRGLGCLSVTPYTANTSGQCKKQSGAESGASSAVALDPRLQAVTLHWLDLPETLRCSVFRQVCETLVLQPLKKKRNNHET